jgi:hypothetical protein
MDSSIDQLQRLAIDYATSADFGPTSLATNLELTRLAPANEGAWTRLSRCYLENGQLDEATGALDSVLLINPSNSIARSLKVEVSKRRIALTALDEPVVKTPARAKKTARAKRTEPA